MAILEFDAQVVRRLVEHTKAAPEHAKTWGQEVAESGLFLAGDQGVYLMSNGNPPLMADGSIGETGKEGKRMVVYAKGINPDTDEGWYEKKAATFGGDDGVEFLPVAGIESGLTETSKMLRISLTRKSIRILPPK